MTGGGSTIPVRINRFTGTVQKLLPCCGWETLESESDDRNKQVIVLSPEDREKLTGTLGISPGGWFEAEIHNGTNKKIRAIIIAVGPRNVSLFKEFVENPGKDIGVREYRLTTTGGEPLSTSQFIARSGNDFKDGDYKWVIKSAEVW